MPVAVTKKGTAFRHGYEYNNSNYASSIIYTRPPCPGSGEPVHSERRRIAIKEAKARKK